MYKLAILDDDEHWCKILQGFLKQEYAMVTYKSVSSFLWELEELNQYDIFLVDFMLPTARYELNTDGTQIVTTLKGRLLHSPVVILVTAYMSMNELEVHGKQMCPEADAFFAKDAGLEILARQMKQLLTSAKTKDS
ncbi:response regulator [Nostoc sp. 'Lobaria pulmonaria (5183) cyanobiont']|uniref:response regulator n=1 Tax=Nostoc sp. 'Lobaria pulmonaria (5183) cyanobiont' TaxID=1618022 RepID=UPI000CF35EBA|nr:response regulator [Nostoc sp. 'Lobaria pulmonaria (5183) cyanobiont']AVH70958.1 response regulator receiver protein [Nostoc sp. 'Lobaria pulmonaria (5183) cyanobiont']